jgi:hypothetical protein
MARSAIPVFPVGQLQDYYHSIHQYRQHPILTTAMLLLSFHLLLKVITPGDLIFLFIVHTIIQ